MRKPRALNRLGVWLCHELNRRNLSKAEFAFLIGTTPQNLSDILRGNRSAEDTLKKWERKCRQALNDMDGIAAVGCEASVSYQIVCSMVEIEGTRRFTYGLQMLENRVGERRIADEIQDISFCPEEVSVMERRFNLERVTEEHFRDLVFDHVFECYS